MEKLDIALFFNGLTSCSSEVPGEQIACWKVFVSALIIYSIILLVDIDKASELMNAFLGQLKDFMMWNF